MHAELLRLNPNWDGEHAVAARENKGSNPNPKRDDRLGIFSSYYCGGPWGYQVTASFWEGFRYLRRIQGQVHMAPGPGACSRVSCSYGSAIVLCNDVSFPARGLSVSQTADKSVLFLWQHTEDFYLDSWNMVADGATRILGLCTTAQNPPQVAGQIFHPDRWNIIVRQEAC